MFVLVSVKHCLSSLREEYRIRIWWQNFLCWRFFFYVTVSRNAPSLLAFPFICIRHNPSKSPIEEANIKIFLRHIYTRNSQNCRKNCIVLWVQQLKGILSTSRPHWIPKWPQVTPSFSSTTLLQTNKSHDSLEIKWQAADLTTGDWFPILQQRSWPTISNKWIPEISSPEYM